MGGFLTEGIHGLNAAAVLTLEGLDKVDAFLKRGELCGVDVNAIGIGGEGALQFLQIGSRFLMKIHKFNSAFVDLLQVCQHAAEVARAIEQ